MFLQHVFTIDDIKWSFSELQRKCESVSKYLARDAVTRQEYPQVHGWQVPAWAQPWTKWREGVAKGSLKFFQDFEVKDKILSMLIQVI